MPTHGFLPETEMAVKSLSDNAVCYYLRDNEFTIKEYPFHFELQISFFLKGSNLYITYEVRNAGDKRMFFGIGGHPGFCVPLEDNLSFEDYYIEFTEKCTPLLVDLSERNNVTGIETEYNLVDNQILPLRHELFNKGAVMLRNTCRRLKLKSSQGTKNVEIYFPDMPYVGFWHAIKTDAPYLCIEPWSSLPPRDGIIEEISTQSGLITLEPDGVYLNQWSIVIHP